MPSGIQTKSHGSRRSLCLNHTPCPMSKWGGLGPRSYIFSLLILINLAWRWALSGGVILYHLSLLAKALALCSCSGVAGGSADIASTECARNMPSRCQGVLVLNQHEKGPSPATASFSFARCSSILSFTNAFASSRVRLCGIDLQSHTHAVHERFSNTNPRE